MIHCQLVRKEVTFLTLKETNFIENISGSLQFSRDINNLVDDRLGTR